MTILTDFLKKLGATMAEYKDITKLKKEISDVKQELWESSCQNRSYITGYVSALSYVEGMIASLPADDVEPVKHGEWLNDDDEWKFYKCSICGNEAYWDTDYGQQLFDFCPHCGAKMDGKEVQE